MKLSERIKAQTDERLAAEAKEHPLGIISITPIPEVLAAFDELDARLAKLEARNPMPPRHDSQRRRVVQASMSRFIVQLTRRGSTLECEVEADDRLEARTLALRKMFGPGAYWYTESDPRQGCAIVPRERKRGKRVVFEEKKRSPIYRIHVERLE